MTEHECTWTSGSVLFVDNDPKIKTNCDICGKEIIEDFDIYPKHTQVDPEELKERMEKYRAGML